MDNDKALKSFWSAFDATKGGFNSIAEVTDFYLMVAPWIIPHAPGLASQICVDLKSDAHSLESLLQTLETYKDDYREEVRAYRLTTFDHTPFFFTDFQLLVDHLKTNLSIKEGFEIRLSTFVTTLECLEKDPNYIKE